MDYLPIFLSLAGRPVLVVGGGEVAARKAALLRRARAVLRVVAPELGDTLAAAGDIEHRARPFVPADLDGADLAIAATDDRAVNAAVAAAARLRHVPVNVVDDPELCSFIMPAIVDRGRVVAAISTGGASPVLASLIRSRLELSLPPGIERLADLAVAWRVRVKAALPDTESRRRFWEALLSGPWAARIAAGEAPDLDTLLAAVPPASVETIAVPEDPDLLTLRDVKRIHAADLVLHEADIPPVVLEHARRDAEVRSIAGDTPSLTLPRSRGRGDDAATALPLPLAGEGGVGAPPPRDTVILVRQASITR